MAEPLFPHRRGDWAYAQVMYETTSKSSDEIATEIGVTTTSVISKASTHGWTRGRKSEIVVHTAELALAAQESAKAMRASKREVIERVNIEMQSKILKAHRTDIAVARRISNKLMTQLNLEIEDEGEDSINLMDASMVLKRMADSMKTFILLERQAYGITAALEELEKPQETMTPEGTALDMLMNKFASVLQKAAPAAAAPPPTMVFEASDGSPAVRP